MINKDILLVGELAVSTSISWLEAYAGARKRGRYCEGVKRGKNKQWPSALRANWQHTNTTTKSIPAMASMTEPLTAYGNTAGPDYSRNSGPVLTILASLQDEIRKYLSTLTTVPDRLLPLHRRSLGPSGHGRRIIITNVYVNEPLTFQAPIGDNEGRVVIFQYQWRKGSSIRGCLCFQYGLKALRHLRILPLLISAHPKWFQSRSSGEGKACKIEHDFAILSILCALRFIPHAPTPPAA